MIKVIKVKVPQIYFYSIDQEELMKDLKFKGILFDSYTSIHDNTQTSEKIYIQKKVKPSIDNVRYERYLEWFIERFIMNEGYKPLEYKQPEYQEPQYNSWVTSGYFSTSMPMVSSATISQINPLQNQGIGNPGPFIGNATPTKKPSKFTTGLKNIFKTL